MKLLIEFGLSSVAIIPEEHENTSPVKVNLKYCVKKSALAFLANPTTKKRAANESDLVNTNFWIDLSSRDVPNVDFFEQIIFDKYKLSQRGRQNKLSDIECELERSLRNRKKHYYDFLTYDDMARTRALKKAHTLCLLSVIENYWQAESNRLLLYQAVRRIKMPTQLRCDSVRGFYYQVNSLIRAGICKGVLFIDTSWSK